MAPPPGRSGVVSRQARPGTGAGAGVRNGRARGRSWVVGGSVLAGAGAWLGGLGLRYGGGVAGTDQFWYAGDLRMTGATGRAVTNHVYPLFAASVPPGVLPPRMHDAPTTHVAAWVFAALGSVPGADGPAWTMVNVTLAFLTAVAVAATARLLGGRGWWGAAAFVVFPSTTWAALSALAEAGLAFAVAVLVGASAAAERTGRGAWWVVAGAAGGLLVWGRSNFVLLLFAWCGWVAWSAWRSRNRAPHEQRSGTAFRPGWRSAAIGTAFAVVAGHALLTQAYPNGGLASTLMVGAAGRSSNMDFYTVPVAFDVGVFLDKAGGGLWRAVTPRTVSELVAVLPVVLAVVVGVGGGRSLRSGLGAGRGGSWRRENRGDRDPAWSVTAFLTVASLITYAVTCAVFQPQVRYLYASAPAAAVLLDVAVSRLVGHRRPLIRGVVAVLTVVVCALGASRSVDTARTLEAADARADAANARLEAALAPHLTEGDAVIVLAPGNATDIAVAYAAIPHPVISVDPALVPEDRARRLADEWRVRAIVSQPRDAVYVESLLGGEVPPPAPVAYGFAVWPRSVR